VFNRDQCLKEQYQLHQRLGRTAAGRQTWLATDLQSNEQVTVKLLAFSPEMQWDELKLFEREAQVLQALNHPRIPRYRDYFSLDKEAELQLPWFGLVQDYIPGDSLQELLDKNKRFSEKQVRAIATQVLDILIYLHELSPPVLHRDIKPSNLILGEDQQVYLVDFGAVQAQAAVTGVTFTVVGTSGYAPLEQFWGRAVAASDLYALGATLIHLLTGTAPADLPQKEGRIYFRDSLRDSFASHVSINPQFITWIEQMTEMELEKRFSTAKQARESLEHGLMQSYTSTSTNNHKSSFREIKVNKSKEQLAITIASRGMYNLFQIVIISCFCSILTSLIFYQEVNPEVSVLAFIIFFFFVGREKITRKTYVLLDRSRNLLKIERKTLFIKHGLQQQAMTEISDPFFVKKAGKYEIRLPSTQNIYKLGGVSDKQDAVDLIQEILGWLNLK